MASDSANGPVMTLINKRICGLRKKLKRIAQFEKSVISQGKCAIKNKEQEEFLKSKPAIVAAVEELEKFSLQPNLSTAIDEEIDLAIQHRQLENVNGYKEVDHHSSIIAYNKTLDDEKNPKSTDSHVLEDLLNLVYLGSMFDVKSQGDFSSIMLTRTHERNSCLMCDDVMLGEKDLELISMMSSLLISSSRSTNSSVSFSHQNALQRCIQHAKLWLAKSEQPIDSNSSDVTYAALRDKLAKIIGSDFLKVTPEIDIKASAAHVAAETAYGFQVPEQNYTMSSYLCEDLIFEIFTRLPSKSLLRFRSLSKSLCSSIASPDFIHMHTFRSPQKVLIQHKFRSGYTYLYTLHREDQLPTPHTGYIGIKPIEPPYKTHYSACVGSCNGIICLIDIYNHITLWNPSIRRKLTLPDCLERCSSCFPRRCSCGAGRLWMKTNWNQGIGFGFDPITDDYKIVILPKCGGSRESSYMYIMKTSSWCAITSPTPSFCEVTSRGCFVNGSLHWVVERHFPESDDVNSYHILTFDLSTHVFGMIALPKPSWKTKQLTIIQGSLAVISSKDDYSCIWMMREYNNTVSWVFFKTKKNSVEGELQRVLQPTNNSDLLLFKTEEEGFQVYDPKVGAQSRLCYFNAYNFIFDMETYVESLHLFNTATHRL